MLDEARVFVGLAPWFIVFPGIAIVVTVLSLNLLGDAVRDLADPHAVAGRGIG